MKFKPKIFQKSAVKQHMSPDIEQDILPNLDWNVEEAQNQANKTTEIYYFSLTTCAYCKKGIQWLKAHNARFNWLYLDKIEMTQKKEIKEWVQKKYNLKTRMASPFVIFRTPKQDFISNGFDPEYWKSKIH